MDGTQESYALAGLGELFGGFTPARCTGLSSICTVGAQSQNSQNLMRGSIYSREAGNFLPAKGD
jgi:hypothetical protein